MAQVRLEDARRIIAAAEKKAHEIGQPMNIAVADETVGRIGLNRFAVAPSAVFQPSSPHLDFPTI